MKFIDLTGNIFGRLTVLSICHYKPNGTYWNCLCECGNKSIVNGCKLKSGKTKSCGCYRKESVKLKPYKPSYLDMVSKVFGRLTVIRFSHVCPKKRNACWICKCECGNEISAFGTSLRSGSVKSCGCLRLERLSASAIEKMADLTGLKFGHLTVLGLFSHTPNKPTLWTCICMCGSVKNYLVGNLKQGFSTSCGCLTKERMRESKTTHGFGRHPLYRRWAGMISRCYNPNVKAYKHYGGRGISVCKEWREDFMNFYNDMSDGFEKELQLDRINVNGDYCKENCRWVTPIENGRNKRNTVFFSINGETKTVKEWASIFNVNYQSMLERVQRGNDTVSSIIYGRTIPIERMKLNKL